MEELFAIESMSNLYESNRLLIMFFVMILAFYPFFLITRKVVSPMVYKAVGRNNESYSKICKNHNLSRHIGWVLVAIYLVFWGNIFDETKLIKPTIIHVKDVFVHVYIVITMSSFLITLLDIGADIYKQKGTSKRLAIGLHVHILKVIITACMILAVLSLVIGVSIASLFTSIGAAAALLTFVFKDTVLGLLASLQLTFQNVIQVGDWVTLPQYNADGDIQKITITVVIIRNFDNTYTTVPTSAFLSTGVKNWRPMFEMGGRRIKRSINIDMNTVKICDQENLDTYKKLPCMVDFAENNVELFNAENSTTNISMFRHYINQYLQNNQNIHQEGFTFLVRQLDPTPTGLPIELYVFTKDTKWANYENIQSDIFDHLLGIMPQFDLRAFQTVIKY